jgi:hypothetical protein
MLVSTIMTIASLFSLFLIHYHNSTIYQEQRLLTGTHLSNQIIEHYNTLCLEKTCLALIPLDKTEDLDLFDSDETVDLDLFDSAETVDLDLFDSDDSDDTNDIDSLLHPIREEQEYKQVKPPNYISMIIAPLLIIYIICCMCFYYVHMYINKIPQLKGLNPLHAI